MIKAAALYMVIVVSLLIAVISASLLTIAFYYRLEVQKKLRFDRLAVNLESGTAILLSEGFKKYNEDLLTDLYGKQKDSVLLHKTRWGVFDLASLKAFELKDTLKRSFFSADVFDDKNAVYLADEDRPLSVSGNTQITGNGQLPKSGLKQAYVDGLPYAGNELIHGSISDSERELPPLDEDVLKRITGRLEPSGHAGYQSFDVRDSVSNSFFNEEQVYKMLNNAATIRGVKLEGKIAVVADTVVHISATAVLNDVLVYAPGSSPSIKQQKVNAMIEALMLQSVNAADWEDKTIVVDSMLLQKRVEPYLDYPDLLVITVIAREHNGAHIRKRSGESSGERSGPGFN